MRKLHYSVTRVSEDWVQFYFRMDNLLHSHHGHSQKLNKDMPRLKRNACPSPLAHTNSRNIYPEERKLLLRQIINHSSRSSESHCLMHQVDCRECCCDFSATIWRSDTNLVHNVYSRSFVQSLNQRNRPPR